MEINADKFSYNKIEDLLNANGDANIINKKDKYKIFSDSITYERKKNNIFSKKNSKAFISNGISIIGDNFNYQIEKNVLNANGNVLIEDKIDNYTINTQNITYDKNLDRIITKVILKL